MRGRERGEEGRRGREGGEKGKGEEREYSNLLLKVNYQTTTF